MPYEPPLPPQPCVTTTTTTTIWVHSLAHLHLTRNLGTARESINIVYNDNARVNMFFSSVCPPSEEDLTLNTVGANDTTLQQERQVCDTCVHRSVAVPRSGSWCLPHMDKTTADCAPSAGYRLCKTETQKGREKEVITPIFGFLTYMPKAAPTRVSSMVHKLLCIR